MANDITVTYENVSIAVGMKIGRIISRLNADGNKSFDLVVGIIKSIKLGKKKSIAEIDKFYPQDIEDLMTDISIYQDMLSSGIMTVDTFFIADDVTIKQVKKWLDCTKNKSKNELSLLSNLEIEGNNNE